MDHQNPNHWRQMFERGRDAPRPASRPGIAPFGYDDGYDPAREVADAAHQPAPLSAQDITDEAVMALGEMEPQEPPELDSPEYKPWVIQRGRPAMMLHLRRMCPKSGLWLGWQLSYPHLFAVEYVGDSQLSVDFGTRMFMIEGKGLDQLARYLQQGAVLMVQEFTPKVWPLNPEPHVITAIKLMGMD